MKYQQMCMFCLLACIAAYIEPNFTLSGLPQPGMPGTPMKSFANFNCNADETSLTPEGIHLVMIASPNEISATGHYATQREVFEFYSKLHGYHAHFLDPVPIMRVFGKLQKDGVKNKGNNIIISKPLMMLYKFRLIFTEHGCAAKWVVFLDMDVFMIDYSRSIESIITYANRNALRHSSTCELIAQDSSTTLNSGLLFFRVSPAGEKIIKHWMESVMYHHEKMTFWQEDQGWLQYVYLKYLEDHLKTPPLYNCAQFNIHALPGAPHMAENAIRNLCYAKMLSYFGLPPGKRSNGKFCLLGGTTPHDRINFKDWTGIASWNKENQLIFTMHLPPKCEELGRCQLKGLFLYHGKDDDVVAKLKGYWSYLDVKKKGYNLTVERAKTAYEDGSESAECQKEILGMFHHSSQSMEWMTPEARDLHNKALVQRPIYGQSL